MKKLFSVLSIIFLLSPLSALALNFDGVDDYVKMPNGGNLNSGPFTMSAWVYVTGENAANIMYIFANMNAADACCGPILFSSSNITGGNGLRMNVGLGANNGPFRQGGRVADGAIDSSFVKNRWEHIVGTWDGTLNYTGIHLYKNGREITYYDTNSLDGSGASAATGSWIIGGRNSDNLRNLVGRINEVRIYNRALMPNEVRMLYRGFSPRSGLIGYWPLIGNTSGTFEPDLSGYRNHGTRTGGPIRAALHPFTRLMKFR